MIIFAEKRAPTVFPMIPCPGSSFPSVGVTIGCLSTNFLPPPVDVTWNSGSITSGLRNFPAMLDKRGTYLSTSLLTVSESDYRNRRFTCNVSHKATGQTINKDVDVKPPPPPPPPVQPQAPKVEVVQASCGETGSVDLICLINDYSPDDIAIQWLLNGEPTSIVPTNSKKYKDNDGNFALRSKISVPKVDWSSGDSYTCKVTHPPTSTKNEDRIRKCSDSDGSYPKVLLLPPSPKELLITKQPTVTCEVSKLDSTESLSFTWRRSDNKRTLDFQSEPEQDYDGKWTVKNSLKLTVSDWNPRITYTCIVHHNDLPSPIEKQIHKREELMTDPTIYIFPPTKEELSNYDFVGLTCLLKNFSHKSVYVQWKKNSQVMVEDYYVNTEPVKDEAGENYIMYSRLTIARSDWLRDSTFTCSGVLSTITSKDIKIEKSRVFFILENIGDDDEDSLWSTAATFITLFLLSFFYSATITLVKVKWLISRILQIDKAEDHFVTVLDSQ